MLSFDLRLDSPAPRSARAHWVTETYGVQPEHVRLKGKLNLPAKWQIGAIVGASGVGKSSVAKELWPVHLICGHDWSAPCILDDFRAELSSREVIEALSAVGLASAPVWLRPYHVLSTGQQFRADLARALASGMELVVYDEFTSVVDRNVARAASVAVKKHMTRHPQRQFVAISCHRDILPWLEVDWYYDMDSGRLIKERLRRPAVNIELHRVQPATWWPIFRDHHYLSAQLANNCRAWLCLANLEGERVPVGFFSVIMAAGMKGWRRGHRIVVLPDYQGMGIGNAMVELGGEILWRAKLRYRDRTTAPGLHHYRRKHPDRWLLTAPPSSDAWIHSGLSDRDHKRRRSSTGRMAATWVYIPASLRVQREC
jgi:ABC-type lipoprotein export system ATPase subunit